MHRVKTGRLRAYLEEWYVHPPGKPVAYRRRRLRFRGAELHRYQQVLEDEYAAQRARRHKPDGGDALRAYNRAAQVRSRARKRARGRPSASDDGNAAPLA